MAEISRPWSGTSVGDAGPYSDNQWATTWSKMIGFGANSANRGVIGGVDNNLRVTAQSPASNAVDVNTGAAVIQGKWYENTTVVPFTISANGSGNPRIDTIVLRADYTAQTVRLALLAGTPAATPAPATLTQTIGVTWEIPLAYIAVANGFSTIGIGDIQNNQDWANIPNQLTLEVTNEDSSGDDLVVGRPVFWLNPSGWAGGLGEVTHGGFSTYAESNSREAAGVVVERIPFGGRGRICVKGYCYVLIGDTVAEGERIGPNSPSLDFTSISSTNKPMALWGTALESGVQGDRILAYIDKPRTQIYGCLVEEAAFSVPNGGGGTAVAFTATDLFDPLAMHSTSVNTSRITVPITGLYNITGNVIYAVSAAHSAQPYAAIRLNGTTVISVSNLPTGTYVPAQPLNAQRVLVANEYVELFVFQTSGAVRSILANLSVTKVES